MAAVKNLVDKDNGLLTQAGSWFGGLNYTEEEKAESDAQTREWGIRALDALAPFKVVQRILAFAAALFWIIAGLNVIIAIWVDELTKEIKMIEGVETLINGTSLTDPMYKFATSDYVFWPVCVVFALYFAGGVLPRKGKS
jgi:hypothetical protein